MFTEPVKFLKQLKDITEGTINKMNLGLSIWQVTDIKSREEDGYIPEYKCQIKHLNFKYTRDGVPMLGIGLGHMKGIIKYPNVGDFVIVAFIEDQPYILGTVFDYFAEPVDSVPLIKLNELMVVNQEKGSILLMRDNNDFIIQTCDKTTGNYDDGCKIKFKGDGSFKVFNKANYGIECDNAGNVTIRGVTIKHTQTPGTW